MELGSMIGLVLKSQFSSSPNPQEQKALPSIQRGTRIPLLIPSTQLIPPKTMDPRIITFLDDSALGLSHGHID